MSEATKEHAFLFKGPLVRAILEGRKTQTRRLVTRRNCESFQGWKSLEFDDSKVPTGAMKTFADNGYLHVACRPEEGLENQPENWTRERIYPKWNVGDRAWVRETWMPFDRDHHIADIKFAYRASCGADSDEIRRDYIKSGRDYRWRPSIHMPRKASRITLEITGVKVERLQHLADKDARAEGIIDYQQGPLMHQCGLDEWNPEDRQPFARDAFAVLWNKINGAGDWESNPWVWAISFKRLTP
jgi:hypothetical protein